MKAVVLIGHNHNISQIPLEHLIFLFYMNYTFVQKLTVRMPDNIIANGTDNSLNSKHFQLSSCQDF